MKTMHALASVAVALIAGTVIGVLFATGHQPSAAAKTTTTEKSKAERTPENVGY